MAKVNRGGGPSARPAAPASPAIAAPPGSEALRPRRICPASAPVFRELDQPLHPAVPYTAPLLGDDPGRGAADRELLAHPLEVDALVAPGAVEGLLAAEPLLADRVELAGELDHLDTLEAREQRLTVDVAPELEALREGPALDQVPGGLEAVLGVEHALHQRGQREHALGRLAVGGADLDVALEPHLGKERGQVQVPVVERGALPGGALGQEAAERDAGHLGPVPSAAQDEVERHVERPLDVVGEARAVAEDEGQEPAARAVGVGPDVAAEAH